jgi:hypothetical protein
MIFLCVYFHLAAVSGTHQNYLDVERDFTMSVYWWASILDGGYKMDIFGSSLFYVGKLKGPQIRWSGHHDFMIA